MCGGVIGKLDKFIGKHTDPLSRWTDHIIGGPIGRLGHWTQNHAIETAAAALGAYYGFAGAVGAGGDAAAGAGAAGAGAEGTAMGGAAGTLGAVDSEAASAAAGYTAADVAGTSSADLAAAAGGVGAAADSGGSFLSSLFGQGAGTAGKAGSFMTGKNALGAMQVLSALYGMEQSKKIQNQASKQAVTAAGEQAVMRSMAAQGYQGSGNMMTALSNYAAGAYGANLPMQAAAVSGQLSSLGLLSAGAGNLAGWNTGAPTQTGG